MTFPVEEKWGGSLLAAPSGSSLSVGPPLSWHWLLIRGTERILERWQIYPIYQLLQDHRIFINYFCIHTGTRKCNNPILYCYIVNRFIIKVKPEFKKKTFFSQKSKSPCQEFPFIKPKKKSHRALNSFKMGLVFSEKATHTGMSSSKFQEHVNLFKVFRTVHCHKLAFVHKKSKPGTLNWKKQVLKWVFPNYFSLGC